MIGLSNRPAAVARSLKSYEIRSATRPMPPPPLTNGMSRPPATGKSTVNLVRKAVTLASRVTRNGGKIESRDCSGKTKPSSCDRSKGAYVKHLEVDTKCPGQPETGATRRHEGGPAVTERAPDDAEDATAGVGDRLRGGAGGNTQSCRRQHRGQADDASGNRTSVHDLRHSFAPGRTTVRDRQRGGMVSSAWTWRDGRQEPGRLYLL